MRNSNRDNLYSCPLNTKEVYILKRKFVVLSVFLSVLLLFSSFSVKANDFSFPAFPEPVEGKSSTHYLISFDTETGTYYLLKPLDPQDVKVISQGNELLFSFTGPAINYYWKAGEGASSWVISNQLNSATDLIISGYHEGTRLFLYSSFDLYYSDDTLFFQRAPIRESFLAQMKRIQMGATLTTLVSLVPLLTVLVISFLAFRKALAWLLKVLRKA